MITNGSPLRLLMVLFLVAISGPVSAAPPKPSAIPGGYRAEGQVKLFLDKKDFSFLAEVSAMQQSPEVQQKDFTLGGYYHLSENFKLGAFYQRAFGIRHDDDWVTDAGSWQWRANRARGENVLKLDATSKALLTSLGGEHWVAELKSRYLAHTLYDDRTLMLRPGLSYFWLRQGELVANFFLQLELDFPLNYGVRPISEKWLYLGSLYHLNRIVDLGPFVAFGWQSWGESAAFKDRGGDSYRITTQTTTIGLSTVFRL